MPKSWRDYLPDKPPTGPCDNSDNRDNSPANEAGSAPNVTNVTNVTALPADVQRGLTFLANAPAPRVRNPEAWPQAIADALRLASEGWAARAISLGWSPLDLFGAVREYRGNPEADGLAIRLCGRRVLALCSSFATVEDDSGNRAYLYRPEPASVVPLWKLGRG